MAGIGVKRLIKFFMNLTLLFSLFVLYNSEYLVTDSDFYNIFVACYMLSQQIIFKSLLLQYSIRAHSSVG